ncbi:MAG: bifunctional cobalt-precorrin-7 (C(5))-methyltransferase/cobalt-precorrin-6B (C(15))-methyltransferase [Acidimicrobiales bacterium]
MSATALPTAVGPGSAPPEREQERPIMVVGVLDGVPSTATEGLRSARLVAGGLRLLSMVDHLIDPEAERVRIGADVEVVLDVIERSLRSGSPVCVLSSGDPGMFGMVRVLAGRFGPDRLEVHPSPSSVALAFARLGLPWDDATVVSAHGRPLADAAALAARSVKAAVLTSPSATPEALGALLVTLGATHEHVAVCASLGSPDELISTTDLAGLAAGSWDPLAVVVLYSGDGLPGCKSLAWGLPEDRFLHRGSMITKAEVRSAVIGRLALPPPSDRPPVLWDVGAGSASVAIECARLAPWTAVFAVERDPEGAEFARVNARRAGVAIHVIEAEAPGCLDALPDPDRVFVGGGGLEVLSEALTRLRAGGTIVATHAAMDRAVVAADLLGNLNQIAASRGRRLPDGGWRLEAENPVFMTWSADD